MRKFTLILFALVAMVGSAAEYDLDLSSLTGDIYNSTTHEFSFDTGWTEAQWWYGEESHADFSAYDEFVMEYVASSDTKFRVYIEPTSGTTQTVYPVANTEYGRTVFKLNSDIKSSIKKIAITSAQQSAFDMSVKRIYVRSKSNASASSLWTGSQELGDWGKITSLTYSDKGALANAKIADVIRVTFTNSLEYNQINVSDASESTFNDGCFDGVPSQTDEQTIEYIIPNAIIAEKIQQSGLTVTGKKVTITKIELVTFDESYDAVCVAIGSDGIATFSTSVRSLDFKDTGVTPYYASEVATTGSVTLTSVRYTRGWQGYILKGSEGKYELPTVSTDEDYPSTNYLKPTGDYAKNDLAPSNESTYHYIFAKNSSGDIGFYKLTGSTNKTLGAHKAYLETDEDITPAGAQVALIFDDGETTSINSINTQHQTSNTQCYNLAGQKVSDSYKGIVIKNGKKYINK